MISSILNRIFFEKKNRLQLKKMFYIHFQVDIDELTEIADDFDVSSVPVLVVIKDGKVEKRMVGLQDTDKIRNWVQSAVK